MNIQMQVAGLGIVFILLCFYARRKSVGLYTELFFKRTMIVTLANVTMDMLSVIEIVKKDYIPEWLCIGICRTYLVLLIWTGCFGLLYICQDIYKGKERTSMQALFATMAIAGSVMVFFFPIYTYHSGRSVYTYGSSVYITYAFCIYFVVLTFAVAATNHQRMNHTRIKAVVMWNIIWMCAAAIQFTFNQLLLVGYASCLGMMILFFELENPEAALDRETGLFNAHTFYQYMEQMYGIEKSVAFFVVGVDLRYTDDAAADAERMIDIAHYLDTIKGAKVFKGISSDFILLFEEKERYHEGLEKVRTRFEGAWNGRVYEPWYVCVPDSLVAESSEEVYTLIHYYKQAYRESNDDKFVEIDRGMVEDRRTYSEMVKIISDALKDDRVEVFLQPIYNVKKHCFTSAEALARIRNTDGTLVSPGMFIPVAEETGLISLVGERVFEKVCQFIQREEIWQLGIDYIEVNLSVYQCESKNLAPRYLDIMEKYDVDPTMINFEVTESASIQSRTIFMQNMDNLIEQGVTFSLDDFGNGESNLNYIVDMPVKIVKFDRYMTQSYFEKSKGKLVMETAIQMILDMNLKIVCEGIETEEQVETVEQLGVQFIQGFYFSKPLRQEEFVKFIEENNA